MAQHVSNALPVYLALSFCFGLLLVSSSPVAATRLYDEADGPVKLFEAVEDFKAAVIESDDRIWLINFFADDCETCQELASKVPDIAEKLDKIVAVGAVNCSQLPEVCGVTGIQFLPSLKVFDWEVKENPYTGVPYKEPPKELLKEGEVKIGSLVKEIKGLVPDRLVRTITDGAPDEDAVFKDDQMPKVLFITTKKQLPVFFKSLSIRFRERLQFFTAPPSNEKLVQKLPPGKDGEDSLYVIKPGGEIVLMDYSIGKQETIDFLTSHARERPSKKETAKEDVSLEETPSKAGHLFPLNGSVFESEVLKAEAPWLVAFFKEPCTEKYEQWEEASATLAGQLRLGDFNISQHPEGEKLLAVAAPGLLLTEKACLSVVSYPFGENKEDTSAEVYTGPLASKELGKFGLASVPDFVHPSESSTALEDFLGLEQWKPKMLLFSAKKETPDMWRALAARFRNAIAFAMISEEETEVFEQFQITKVPKVLTIFAKPGDGAEGVPSLSVQPFPMALKFSNLAVWCHQIAQTVSQAMKQRNQGGAESVTELRSDDDFQQQCVARGICIVALLDASKASHKSQVDTLKQVAQTNSLGPITFAWVDLSSAPSFAGPLGLSLSDAPTIVLLNAKKMRYVRLQGSFDARSLQRFVDGVASGKTAVSVLEELPTFTGAPAESDDATFEQVEEEFTLEDLMQEEVDASSVKSRQEKLAELEQQLEAEAAASRLEAEKAASASPKKKKRKSKGKKVGERSEL